MIHIFQRFVSSFFSFFLLPVNGLFLLYKRIRTIEFDFSARITYTIRFDRCGKIEIWITGSRLFLLLSSHFPMRTPYVRSCYDTQNTYRRCSVKYNITFASNNVADEKCISASLCFGHGFMRTHSASYFSLRYPGSNVLPSSFFFQSYVRMRPSFAFKFSCFK